MDVAPAANWPAIRLRCTVIGCLLPGGVAVQFESREVECNEELLHWDRVGLKVLSLVGSQQRLRSDFVPLDLQRANQEFWIALDFDGHWMLFRTPDAHIPDRRVAM